MDKKIVKPGKPTVCDAPSVLNNDGTPIKSARELKPQKKARGAKCFQENWRDVTDADLRGALATVKYGYEPKTARNLIEYFHQNIKEHIESGTPYNEKLLLDLLMHAFGKFAVEGWSADHAFGLKQKRGTHARKPTVERDVRAAARVILFMRQGRAWQEAVGDTANQLFPDGRGDKAVQFAYSTYHEDLRHMPDDLLAKLASLRSPGQLRGRFKKSDRVLSV